MDDINHQYNNVSEAFAKAIVDGNKDSRKAFGEFLPETLEGLRVLDLGCGNGQETVAYRDLGASNVLGVDASEKLLKEASEIHTGIDFKYGLFDSIPAEDSSFDYIFSKYALQTTANLDPVWEEIDRVLKPGGTVMFLVVHPIRQFIEKKVQPKNYFEQKIVDSVCFGGAVTFMEPTHTLKEYFPRLFLSKYTLEVFDERFDIDAEKIVDTYPGFLILRWKKQNNET